jgi:hypothetical protein
MTTPSITPFRAGRTLADQTDVQPGRMSAEAAKLAFSGPVTLLADVSEFQPNINDAAYLKWSKAIIFRGAYGTRTDNAWFGGARRAALHAGGARFVGIYQYVRADQDAAAQGKYFGQLIGDAHSGEFYVADIEEGSGSQQSRWVAWADAFHAEVGVPPHTYSGLSFASSHGLAPVTWVAAYQTSEPSVGHTLWQFTDSYAVPGVGTCDCSVFHGTIDQLAALAYQPGTTQKGTTGVKITAPPPGNWEGPVIVVGKGIDGNIYETKTTDGKTWTPPVKQ